jgi:hypothetical protein
MISCGTIYHAVTCVPRPHESVNAGQNNLSRSRGMCNWAFELNSKIMMWARKQNVLLYRKPKIRLGSPQPWQGRTRLVLWIVFSHQERSLWEVQSTLAVCGIIAGYAEVAYHWIPIRCNSSRTEPKTHTTKVR